MQKLLKTLWREDKGENMPEYALLLFLVSLFAVSAMGSVATRVNKLYVVASIHMATASNSALVSGPVGYTGDAPANPDLNPKQVNQGISR